MSRTRNTHADSEGIATLERIRSHLADMRRKALWQNRCDDFAAYDGALELVGAVTRSLRMERTTERRSRKALEELGKLAEKLAA